ncbi:hypothetical protein H4CHR_02941 [Variovorax sp. PBS-H4]|uniref:hypothetical protein n=1 Tax=Variovorax sp. PBS-H4 TaxID=434008 RepID=UPI001319A3AB|nr:hypothetical protein [Variovorax sp. PBS-H4]VTU32093.1 hypothetical protein H4CHR_02941 [Variovorax sp. PBS-H4]
MNKIQVTAQQRANALEALNVMWPSVPPENVVHDLYTWRQGEGGYSDAPTCGTLACFGGWAEWWPAFRAQLPDGVFGSWNRLAELFGPRENDHVDDLFNSREGHVADDGFTGTDHELVTNRLRWLIENSEVVE